MELPIDSLHKKTSVDWGIHVWKWLSNSPGLGPFKSVWAHDEGFDRCSPQELTGSRTPGRSWGWIPTEQPSLTASLHTDGVLDWSGNCTGWGLVCVVFVEHTSLFFLGAKARKGFWCKFPKNHPRSQDPSIDTESRDRHHSGISVKRQIPSPSHPQSDILHFESEGKEKGRRK